MKNRRLFWERAVRIAADFCVVNIAWLTALMLRIVVQLFLETGPATPARIYAESLRVSLEAYSVSALPLTAVCLTVFYLSGFYTYGRVYRGKFKAFIIFQAVTLSYLIFWFLWTFLQIGRPFPRAALIGGWLGTLVLVEASRFVSVLWSALLRSEERELRARALRTERVLVIGGAGYLGSVLVRKLLGRGYHVRVFDALLYGEHAMGELRRHPRFQFLQGDFRNVETVVTATRDMDAVVHVGAIVGDPASGLDQEFTREVNVAATRLIAEVARGFGAHRFVFTSTCSVYGSSDDTLNEDSPPNPQTTYDLTKLQAERVLLSLAHGAFAPVILRLGTLYGLSYRPRFDLVVNLLVARALQERKITIYGGEQWRPFVHVDDAADAILLCLDAPIELVKGQVFNVATARQNLRLREVAATIQEALPDTVVEVSTDNNDAKNYLVSSDKIQRVLGFQAKKTIRDAVDEIKLAFDRGWITDYAAKEYSNYSFLESRRPSLIQHTGIPYVWTPPEQKAPSKTHH